MNRRHKQRYPGLSDEGIEDVIYNHQAIRRFVKIDLSREAAPDATTLLKFRRLLKQHGLTRNIFETIIAAPPSAKSRDKKRDPEMYQTKKRNRWHSGMKAHIGADANSTLVYSVAAAAANASNITKTHALLHGEELVAFSDVGYQGVHKREKNHDSAVCRHVAMKRTQCKALPDNEVGALRERLEQVKVSVRTKVEHPFRIVKNLFRHRNTRYRGLAKNEAQLFALFGLANLPPTRSTRRRRSNATPLKRPANASDVKTLFLPQHRLLACVGREKQGLLE